MCAAANHLDTTSRSVAEDTLSEQGFRQEDAADIDQVNASLESLTQIRQLESDYFDASSMAPLSPTALQAIARLRAYKPPPFPLWNKLPVNRRAAVLLLLYADRRGDLRVVITMRASTLRNFSGHAALPGGKADTLTETPFQIARREAMEEIGLPLDNARLPYPFRIEHLCEIPHSLARTEIVVRPCIAFLHSDDPMGKVNASVEESMIPRLDAKEVAAVFSAPFHNFLKVEDEVRDETLPGKPSDWYDGGWRQWNNGRWRLHNFHVPVNNQKVTKPKQREGGQEAVADELDDEPEDLRYLVWGMTARVLVDAARIAYGEEPEMEHNEHFGDEEMIEWVNEQGRFTEKKRPGPDLAKEDPKNAKM